MNDKLLDQLDRPSEGEISTERPQTPEELAAKEQEAATPDHNEQKHINAQHPAKELLHLKTKKIRPSIPQLQDPVAKKIEKILESGLADEFSKLTPIQQQEFKIKGEDTALEIRELLKSTHIKVKTIFALIVAWLRLLPGINKFFLEQEAKIKTDHIIELHKKEKTDNILL